MKESDKNKKNALQIRNSTAEFLNLLYRPANK